MRRLISYAAVVLLIIAAAIVFPRLLYAQPKSLEPIKIGYSGIGIAHGDFGYGIRQEKPLNGFMHKWTSPDDIPLLESSPSPESSRL